MSSWNNRWGSSSRAALNRFHTFAALHDWCYETLSTNEGPATCNLPKSRPSLNRVDTRAKRLPNIYYLPSIEKYRYTCLKRFLGKCNGTMAMMYKAVVGSRQWHWDQEDRREAELEVVETRMMSFSSGKDQEWLYKLGAVNTVYADGVAGKPTAYRETKEENLWKRTQSYSMREEDVVYRVGWRNSWKERTDIHLSSSYLFLLPWFGECLSPCSEIATAL